MICSIKCAVIDQFRWHFDDEILTKDSLVPLIKPPSANEDPDVLDEGLRRTFQIRSPPTFSNIEHIEERDGQMRRVLNMGSKSIYLQATQFNRPVCPGGRDAILSLAVSEALEPLGVIPASFRNIAELCNNVLFEGNPSANLGGVCWHGPDGLGEYILKDELRPPSFTTDFYAVEEISRVIRSLWLLENECRRLCRCSDFDHYYWMPTNPSMASLGEGLRAFINRGLSPVQYISQLQEQTSQSSGQGSTSCSNMDCRSAIDCQGSSGADSASCQCIARSQTARPGSLGVMAGFIAFCGSSLVSGGSRARLHGRDMLNKTSPCVCNATYISKACCDSANGLVWEAAYLKLGQVIL
ncbi:MAG: hypothetical protein M1814_001535 [Vezdaea aestivalis]|nr:MAG: hypothetical protein M1814_001535 [Vezdaea aestivalis]